MRKEDFLEILKDYLKKGFSEDEIIDILRDYESCSGTSCNCRERHRDQLRTSVSCSQEDP